MIRISSMACDSEDGRSSPAPHLGHRMQRTIIIAIMLAAAAALRAATTPDLGQNVIIIDPSTDAKAIQERCDRIFEKQFSNQFGSERYAILFRPGAYHANISVGFYTQLAGLGRSPDDVTINGVLQTKAFEANANVTQNFWRSCENFTAKPPDKAKVVWAVSQAAPMRRMHINGDLWLFIGGWASGGWLSDTRIDGQVVSGSQQQWISRNCEWGSWQGGVWNMVHLGVVKPPLNGAAGGWNSTYPHTVIEKTPVIAEKPYLRVGDDGSIGVFVPAQKRDSIGCGWHDAAKEAGSWLALDRFHIAKAGSDSAATMNSALAAGRHLLLTPGIYHLSEPLKVVKPGTIVLGLGMATLLPDQGNAAVEVADVDGVRLAGLLIDAGEKESAYLVQVGAPGSTQRHEQDPTYLYDIFCRIGGAGAANVAAAVIINSSDVVGDHTWIWRADHGEGSGWTSSRGKNGLIVNGAHVSYYGLFVEHFQEYQTLWNGDDGRLVFYQCELPYDIPSQAAWSHGSSKGWAGYKVADTVTSHSAAGLGIYSFFRDAPASLDHAIEVPKAPGVRFTNMIGFWLTGKDGSSVDHVINDAGEASTKDHREARLHRYPSGD
jgi:hypothetical protein